MENWSITGRFNGDPEEGLTKNEYKYLKIVVVYQNETGFFKSIPAFFFDSSSEFSQYKKIKKFIERKKILNGYLVDISGESYFDINKIVGLCCLGITVSQFEIFELDSYNMSCGGMTNEILNALMEEKEDDGL